MDINTTWTPGDNASADVITFIGRIDGTAVTVQAAPTVSRGTPIVVLRTQPPLLDVHSVVYLVPDEAHRLAALLSSAALTSVGRSAARPGPTGVPPPGIDSAITVAPDADPASSDAADGAAKVRSRHIVSAGEGSTAAELRRALALLPIRARLVDFVSDTDVALVFNTDDHGWSVNGPV